MEKTTRRFRDTASTLAELNAEGLGAQTVNDPLTMCVGAASQHVLRMSFCSGARSQDMGHRGHRSLVSTCLSSLEDLVLAQLCSVMPLPRGELVSR